MYKRFGKLYIFIIIILLFSIAYCIYSFRFGHSSNSSTGKMSASFDKALNDSMNHKIDLKNGETIKFSYDINIKSGNINAIFRDSLGKELYNFEPDTDGTKEIKIDKDGSYEVEIECVEAKGNYRIQWKIE